MNKILICFCVTIIVHEATHYVCARKFKRNPKLKFEFFSPVIEYTNTNNYCENCIISISPFFIHMLFILLGDDYLKVVNYGFLAMIFPVTADGYIFWASIINFLRERNQNEK